MNRLRLSASQLLPLAEDVAQRGGFLRFEVHGRSMAPSVCEGDQVLVGPTRLAPGALILARVEGQPVLHRLVGVRGRMAVLRADNGPREDLVHLNALVAEVYAVEPARSMVKALRRAFWRTMATLLTAAAVLFCPRAHAQCTVTKYIVVDGQTCDWTAAQKPLVINGGGGGAAPLKITQTKLTDNYNPSSTGNGNLYGLMTMAAGTTFARNNQVGVYLNVPGLGATDPACGANAGFGFTCTANPCTNSANWSGLYCSGVTGNACQGGTTCTTFTAAQFKIVINGTTVEWGVNMAAIGTPVNFTAIPFSTTNAATNANFYIQPQTAYSAVTIGPTASRMADLAAHSDPSGVTLGWVAHDQRANLGFWLWRSRDNGAWEALTPNPVRPAAALGAPGSQAFRFVDAAGKQGDRYVLSDMDRRSGEGHLVGPVAASPTAALPRAENAFRPATVPRLPSRQGKVARLGVSAEGIYRVTHAALQAAGVSVPRSGQLTFWGRSITAVADPAGWTFYAGPVQNAYDGVDAYLLGPGPLGQVPAQPAATGRFDRFVRTQLHVKQAVSYDWYKGGDDPYVWGWSSNLFPVDPLAFDTPAAASQGTGALHLRLLGGTDFDHHVQVQVNGTALGDARWTGAGEQDFDASVPSGVLSPGGNTLSVVSVLDTGAPYEFVLVDSLDIRYARAPQAVEGHAKFALEPGHCAVVTSLGFGATAWDVTDPARAIPEAGVETAHGLSVCSPRDGRTHTFWAFDARSVGAPSLRAAGGEGLNAMPAVDELIVVHDSLASEVGPLEAARRAQGLSVQTVRLGDIYDAFGGGNEGGEPIKAFLSQARARYVLLVGGANADVRNVLGTGVPALIPSGVVVAGADGMRAATDSWYVTGADGITPTKALGRLAVDTPADAAAVIGKIVAGEQQGAPAQSAVLAADIMTRPDDADFAMNSAVVGARLNASGLATVTVSAGDATPAAALSAALTGGADLWQYVGHAGTSVWGARQWLSVANVSALRNTRLPVLASYDCLDGMFDNPTTVSLGWAAVGNPLGGALAAFVPSTVLSPREGHVFNLLVAGALTGGGPRLGDALLLAQQQAALDPALADYVRTYNLLGDPASYSPLVAPAP